MFPELTCYYFLPNCASQKLCFQSLRGIIYRAHYLSCIIISLASLFLTYHYFSCIIISRLSLFLAHHYFLYFVISYTSLFLIHYYFLCIIMCIVKNMHRQRTSSSDDIYFDYTQTLMVFLAHHYLPLIVIYCRR